MATELTISLGLVAGSLKNYSCLLLSDKSCLDPRHKHWVFCKGSLCAPFTKHFVVWPSVLEFWNITSIDQSYYWALRSVFLSACPFIWDWTKIKHLLQQCILNLRSALNGAKMRQKWDRLFLQVGSWQRQVASFVPCCEKEMLGWQFSTAVHNFSTPDNRIQSFCRSWNILRMPYRSYSILSFTIHPFVSWIQSSPERPDIWALKVETQLWMPNCRIWKIRPPC